MMIEALASFSVAQSLAGFTVPTPSTKWLNLQENRNLLMSGNGQLYIEVRVTTAFNDGSTGLAGFIPCVCTSDVADGGGTVVMHLAPLGINPMADNLLPGLPYTQLTLNRTVYLPLPRPSVMVSNLTTLLNGVPAYLQQYLGMIYLNPAAATTPWSAGAVSARLVASPGGSVAYKDSVA